MEDAFLTQLYFLASVRVVDTPRVVETPRVLRDRACCVRAARSASRACRGTLVVQILDCRNAESDSCSENCRKQTGCSQSDGDEVGCFHGADSGRRRRWVTGPADGLGEVGLGLARQGEGEAAGPLRYLRNATLGRKCNVREWESLGRAIEGREGTGGDRTGPHLTLQCWDSDLLSDARSRADSRVANG